MKNTLKTILSLLLALAMIFSMAACGNSGGAESTPTDAVDDDFFTDVENEVETSSQAQTSSEAGNKNSDETESAKPNTSSKESSANGGSANKPDDSSSWKGMLDSMPKDLRGSKLVVVNWNPVSEYTGASAAIKEFEKQTGISVEWVTVEHSVYTTRLATMVASNNSPDVVRTRTPNPAWLQSFQSIEAAKYDFSDKIWDQTLMKDYTVNGVTYATSLKGTHIGSVDMMFYNMIPIRLI